MGVIVAIYSCGISYRNENLALFFYDNDTIFGFDYIDLIVNVLMATTINRETDYPP